MGFISFWFAAVAAVAAGLSGPLNKFTALPYTVTFGLLGIALAAAGVGFLAGFFALVGRVLQSGEGGSVIAPVVGLLLGAAIAGFLGYQGFQATKYPVIHDITTDTVNPPVFEAVVPLRGEGSNPLTYAGKKAPSGFGGNADLVLVSELQAQHYPDIAPLVLPRPVDDTMAQARALAEARGWTIVAQEADRLEASVESAWFGFVDDVVIRLTPVEGGTRVDMRSVSRVGRSDLGANAARVRDFLQDLG